MISVNNVYGFEHKHREKKQKKRTNTLLQCISMKNIIVQEIELCILVKNCKHFSNMLTFLSITYKQNWNAIERNIL